MHHPTRADQELVAAAIVERERRQSKRTCEASLAEFVKQAWHVLEPSQRYVHGWVVDAICSHLEAVTRGEISRLLINVPPGMSKSMITGVLWPAWIWGPQNRAAARFVGASYAEKLSIRDATKMRRLVTSEWYQSRWGDRVSLTKDQNAKLKFENTSTGFREASAAGSLTGSRGDFLLIDDPHSVESAGSDAMRQSTMDWFLEAVPLRLNNPETSAIVVIMQRLHEEDVSGIILSRGLGYTHLCLPMRMDASRRCQTSIGFTDTRKDGQLLFPERFPEHVVARDEKVLGVYATAGQFQQQPAPRGGGIIKREWWGKFFAKEFPTFHYIVASVDTAYTEKQENDPSALTVWGLYDKAGETRALLIDAWAERLELNALVRKVAETCKSYDVEMILIEAKASGLSVSQELRRLYSTAMSTCSIRVINPGLQDKVARVYAIQPMFENGLIEAPFIRHKDGTVTPDDCTKLVMDQMSVFPKGSHDDLVDCSSQALRYVRDLGLMKHAAETAAEIEEELRYKSPQKRVYPV